MEVNEFIFEFHSQPILIEEIKFGHTRYLYIGSTKRVFDDLSLAYPQPPASSHLIGDKPTDDLALFLSSYFKGPFLVSYSFPLTTDEDQERFDFVKLSLCKHYKQQSTK